MWRIYIYQTKYEDTKFTPIHLYTINLLNIFTNSRELSIMFLLHFCLVRIIWIPIYLQIVLFACDLYKVFSVFNSFVLHLICIFLFFGGLLLVLNCSLELGHLPHNWPHIWGLKGNSLLHDLVCFSCLFSFLSGAGTEGLVRDVFDLALNKSGAHDLHNRALSSSFLC